MNTFFSKDYLSARAAFLAASQNCGACVETYRNELAEGDGPSLYTDVAIIGDASAEKALVLMSGTHGVEGFAGSAIQTGAMDSGLFDNIGSNLKIVMIHALNPYGFANLRRTNEDNVDLNRNFLDFTAPLPENQDYDRLADVIAPKSFAPQHNMIASLRIMLYRLRYGRTALQQAVSSGQYKHPTGLFYGGDAPVWSHVTLREIVERFLSNARRVGLIDIHTGLGPHGFGELILHEASDDPALTRAAEWWGEERIKSAAGGDSVSSQLAGTVNLALSRMLPDAEVTAAGLEFGTLPLLDVFKAMRAENWLFHHGQEGALDSSGIKRGLLQAFCPDDDGWRKKVLEQGQWAVARACAALKGDRLV